jgi:glycosyltransferase involved in cell wall biosynthesis
MLEARGIEATVIQNGFVMSAMPLTTEREIDVLWVGRCESWKNPSLFLDLALALPNRSFVMICPPIPGMDEFFENIRSRASTIANLRFIERVQFEESESYFRNSRILVGTSDAEGFPNTYIQACIAGTPIVSYKVDPGGFIELTGAGVVCGGDFGRLVNQAEQLLRDEAGWSKRSSRARRYALRSHDIKVRGKQWAELFRSLHSRDRSDFGRPKNTLMISSRS